MSNEMAIIICVLMLGIPILTTFIILKLKKKNRNVKKKKIVDLGVKKPIEVKVERPLLKYLSNILVPLSIGIAMIAYYCLIFIDNGVSAELIEDIFQTTSQEEIHNYLITILIVCAVTLVLSICMRVGYLQAQKEHAKTLKQKYIKIVVIEIILYIIGFLIGFIYVEFESAFVVMLTLLLGIFNILLSCINICKAIINYKKPEYFCSNCGTEIFDSEFRCSKCQIKLK